MSQYLSSAKIAVSQGLLHCYRSAVMSQYLSSAYIATPQGLLHCLCQFSLHIALNRFMRIRQT
jgi:hypothetical protein